MKKLLFLVPAVIVVIAVVARRSEALGGESLGCFVSGTTPVQFHAPSCAAKKPKPLYIVTFQVLNGSGSYDYAWNTNGLPVSSGCTSTDASCAISVTAVRDDQTLPVSVTISQSGQQWTLSATGFIPAVCTEYDGSLIWC